MSKQTLPCRNLYRFGGSTLEAPEDNNADTWTRTDAGWITGRTVDEAGNPLPYARIRIYLHDCESVSDANGFFLVTCIPAGDHMVIVDHESFSVLFIPHVKVGGGGTSLETVRMDERILPAQQYQESREYLE